MLFKLTTLLLLTLQLGSLVSAAPAKNQPPSSITIYSKPNCRGTKKTLSLSVARKLYNKSQATPFPGSSFKLPSALRPQDQLDISTSPVLDFSSAATKGKTGADFRDTACEQFKMYFQAGAENGQSHAVGPGQCVDVQGGFSCVRIWDSGARVWPDLGSS
ncbi:hypothetical protein BDV18DRAFT_160785 [Aspergillus unguis]